jgi:hypothetical protein
MRAGRAGVPIKKRKKPDLRSRVYIHEQSTRASQITKASTITRSGQLRTFTSASPTVPPPPPLQDEEEMVDLSNPASASPCPSGITIAIPAKRYVNSVCKFTVECTFTC